MVMSRGPTYPALYRERGDPASLKLLESLDHAQLALEVLEVEDQEYESWDSLGYEVKLTSRGPAAREWLVVSVIGDRPGVTTDFLLNVVREYGLVNGANLVWLSGESVGAYYKRIEQQLKQRRLSSCPWWRRFLRLDNR